MYSRHLGSQLSLDATKAGAIEAANYIAIHADPLNLAAYATVIQKAIAEAFVVTSHILRGVAQVFPPAVTFYAQDIDHSWASSNFLS